ncbi:MAG TPA: SUMF1/EgtB/PvdO family nonheme iron enzyme [Spirochaetota bacterium]|nr:SUMF1/EgtB/PvdO family nonheme iron enzyme [Spirochaetota bacterium]
MLDLSDFLYIDSADCRVGIDRNEISPIISNLLPGKIKKEYIEASTPSVEVKLSPFYISKKLVTVHEFNEFVEATSYLTESEREGWGWVWETSWEKRNGVSWRNPFGSDPGKLYFDNAAKFPVMQVSWNDAVAYTEWKSVTEKKNVKLPSEVQWEIFAEKTGVKSISESLLSGTDSNVICSSMDFFSALERKLESSLYNVGLLWEWTLDWYAGYSPEVSIKDFGNIYKVLRGGSLLSDEIQKAKEFRFRRCPTARSPYYGFRIVLMTD